MRPQRCVNVDLDRAQCYHVISRVVNRQMIFGREEKAVFLDLMERHSAFSGVEVLAYCLMGNNFQLLLHVPLKPKEITRSEVKSRMKAIYNDSKIQKLKKEFRENQREGEENRDDDEAFYESLSFRMYSLSKFIKDLKQKFSVWYNTQNDRRGTLWESQYRIVLMEESIETLMASAVPMEPNPGKNAGNAEEELYYWCAYNPSGSS